MKKLVYSIITCLFLVSFSACGNKETEESSADNSYTNSTVESSEIPSDEEVPSDASSTSSSDEQGIESSDYRTDTTQIEGDEISILLNAFTDKINSVGLTVDILSSQTWDKVDSFQEYNCRFNYGDWDYVVILSESDIEIMQFPPIGGSGNSSYGNYTTPRDTGADFVPQLASVYQTYYMPGILLRSDGAVVGDEYVDAAIKEIQKMYQYNSPRVLEIASDDAKYTKTYTIIFNDKDTVSFIIDSDCVVYIAQQDNGIWLEIYESGDEALWQYEAKRVTDIPNMDTLIEKVRLDNGYTEARVIETSFTESTGLSTFDVLFDEMYKYQFAINEQGTRYVRSLY